MDGVRAFWIKLFVAKQFDSRRHSTRRAANRQESTRVVERFGKRSTRHSENYNCESTRSNCGASAVSEVLESSRTTQQNERQALALRAELEAERMQIKWRINPGKTSAT